jgi:hypothetical protein
MKLTPNSDPKWLLKHAEDIPAAPKTYKVSDQRFPWLVKQVERLNKMVASINKRGGEFGASPMPPIEIKVINDGVQIQDKSNPDMVHIGKEILITGQTPQIKGWKFVATIMPLVDEQGKQANVIKSVPGAGPVPEKYRTSVQTCDYCNKKILRNETFLLLGTVPGETTKTYKEIGRNCLAKFLNTTSPESVADMAEAYASLIETVESFDEEFSSGEFDGMGGGGGVRGVAIGTYVANVIAIQRAAGWLSRSKAREEQRDGAATADLAWDYMDPKSKDIVTKIVKKMSGKDIEHRPEDIELAKKVIQWSRDLRKRAPESLNDYLSSISSATSVPYVPRKLIGYVASIVSAHQRNEARKGYFKVKVQKKSTTEQGTTAWILNDKGKDVVWFDAQHDPQVDATLDKAIADQSDVYFSGSMEYQKPTPGSYETPSPETSYTAQGMSQAIIDKFMTPEEYAVENKAAIEAEQAAQEKLKSAPPLVPQGKAKMTLTVDKIKSIESQYGTKVKYEMTDEFGRKFFWMTTSSQELQEGQTYEANVTVGWEKVPGANVPVLYCPEHPDTVLQTQPKKKGGLCPVDQKWQDKPLRKLTSDKFTGATRLDSVTPLSVGGQALITGDDINSINKQIKDVMQQQEVLNEQIKPLSSEEYQLLNDAGVPTSLGQDRMNDLADAKAVVAREIERAKASPQDQEFEANYEGASHYLGYKFSGLRFRNITPEELLQETNVIRAKNDEVLAKIKSFVPQVDALMAEYAAAKGNWKLEAEKAGQMYEVLNGLKKEYDRYGNQANDAVVIEWPYFRNTSYLGERDVAQMVQFFKEPKANFDRINSATEHATNAIQSGAPMDLNKIWPPSGIEFKKRDPIYPSRFIQVAQQVLSDIAKAEARIPVILQQLVPLKTQVETLKNQENDLHHKLSEMDESRRRGRPKTSAWIAGIIKKS